MAKKKAKGGNDSPKKKKVVVDEEDDDDRDDAPPVPKKKKIPNDAFTGMLALAFLAFVGGCVLFYLDHDELEKQTLSQPSFTVPGLGLQGPAAVAGPQN